MALGQPDKLAVRRSKLEEEEILSALEEVGNHQIRQAETLNEVLNAVAGVQIAVQELKDTLYTAQKPNAPRGLVSKVYDIEQRVSNLVEEIKHELVRAIAADIKTETDAKLEKHYVTLESFLEVKKTHDRLVTMFWALLLLALSGFGATLWKLITLAGP